MNIYDYYINFTVNKATGQPSVGYLNKMVYVLPAETNTAPLNKISEDQFVTVYSAADVEKLDFIGENEKDMIKKAFGHGLSSLYIRACVTDSWGEGESPSLNLFKVEEELLEIEKIAFTLVLSPSYGIKEKPADFGGVLVCSSQSVPTKEPVENTVVVYDPTKDGKALGILTLFLEAGSFTNMQLKNIEGYGAIAPTGLVKTLKDLGITFIFNDGLNPILGMLTVGRKAVTHPYISELWRYNVRQELLSFLQVSKPTYINSSILIIEDIINKICDQFVNNGYFQSYSKTLAPLVENQLASDVDSFLVNNVKVEYQTSGAIWAINIDVKE